MKVSRNLGILASILIITLLIVNKASAENWSVPGWKRIDGSTCRYESVDDHFLGIDTNADCNSICVGRNPSLRQACDDKQTLMCYCPNFQDFFDAIYSKTKDVDGKKVYVDVTPFNDADPTQANTCYTRITEGEVDEEKKVIMGPINGHIGTSTAFEPGNFSDILYRFENINSRCNFVSDPSDKPGLSLFAKSFCEYVQQDTDPEHAKLYDRKDPKNNYGFTQLDNYCRVIKNFKR